MQRHEKHLLAAALAFAALSCIIAAVSSIEEVQVLKLQGYSMAPASYPGDFSVCVETRSYKEGDVVSFNYSTELNVSHRVVEANSSGVVTKGDNNSYRDGFTRYEQVFCERKLVIPTHYL